MKKDNGFSKYYKYTIIIGFGFFTMGLMETLYDAYVPLHLKRYFLDRSTDQIKGFIMTIDNILAIFLIPLFSILSDRTKTKMGRRMPYILGMLPICAILFALLPAAAIPASAGLLIAAVIIFNIVLKPARGIVVALMPDTIPGKFRSEANGIINTMGGIGAIIGTLVLAPFIVGIEEKIPALDGMPRGLIAFPVAALFVIIAVIVLAIYVREKPELHTKIEKKITLKERIQFILQNKNLKSILLILAAIFFWFLGYEGLKAFLSIYSVDFLHLSDSKAALTSGIVGVGYALFAVVSGFIAAKLGRKKTILISLFTLFLIMLFGFIFTLIFNEPEVSWNSVIVFWVMMFIFGLFWSAVAVNSFPILWQMSSFKNIGMFTGFYYMARQTAAIAGPISVGYINKMTNGFDGMFIFAAISMIIAFGFVLFIKHGEADEELEQSA